MPLTRIILLTILSLLAFASNSLLCRIALKQTDIDPASFTAIRLISGATVLWLVANLRKRKQEGKGNWLSALALFAYAAAFSFAYVNLSAGTGALILFGAVQATMIGYGLWRGEKLRLLQWLGLMLALAGLVGLVLPGLAAPPLGSAVLMCVAGATWGMYSLRGRGAGDPTKVSAGNFLRAAPMAIFLSLLLFRQVELAPLGVAYALVSGGITSGLGYIFWYTVLPSLKTSNAATLQLSVPVIAALGGIVFLGEPLSLRLVLASVAILGGIGLVVLKRH